ncbi:MAG TPA: HesA/MoeB/ThiF family protein [Geminicoccus sp.]|jgi:molybdopterin/thiamine biosynthesis adenylyltransferase|uniref:HesA/MoeB/ThiF family protein n=1 Tax=Geminicoccus sp. TaxID=2024832 RepID=UPI002E337657|nr:HesA/MoeB/ThiF family protein [Geminicoccus sp.]HEX2529652.1 HesA/MoeB/ThiF family protein [Geminicoccus sp.]
MNSRYARQMVLPEVGEAGQAKLAAASVLVVGAGGLGSPVLLNLAGAGIGKLTIIDHDRVEMSNLHRQPLYRQSDAGAWKAEAAKSAILAYNSEISVASLVQKLMPSNAASLVEDADLVVDAADSLAVTYILSDACRIIDKPLISAAVLGLGGYVGAFCGGAPSYRAVFPDMPSTVGSCAANGVLGPVVATLGSLQAHMVLQLVLGLQPSPAGRLVSVDLSRFGFGGFSFLGTPEPDGPPLPFIDPATIEPDDVVVDLRGSEEAPSLVTDRALRILPADIASAELPRDRRIVLACSAGIRAHRAARLLASRRFPRLAVVAIGS